MASGGSRGRPPKHRFLAGKKYRLGRKIDSGMFGDIYIGKNIENDEHVALKLESRYGRSQLLWHEYNIYRILNCDVGFPRVRWFGEEKGFNVLVMDLLGQNLEKLFESCGRRFSLKTTLMLAVQMIDILEHLHRKSYIYRDIKPQNFLMGTDSRAHKVCYS